MPDSATITREQLRTVVITTELGGKTSDSDHFSYAKLGKSTYSFGQLQFDVGHSDSAKDFLKENGFDTADIKNLSQHGGLSRKELNGLDAKLQAIAQAKMNQFTHDQLDKTISSVGDVIDGVRKQNPAAADAIAKDAKLQLGIADYKNQFGDVGPQAIGFLAGKSETLHATGITVKAGNPPTREDLQTFIGAGGFGQNPANARGIAGREEHFNEAMAELKLGPPVKGHGHAASHHPADAVLKQGMHNEQVQKLQTQLGELGYLDKNVTPDGRFGSATAKAVEAFQTDHHLTKGSVGPITQGALQSDLQPLRQDNMGPLPAVSAMSSLPAGAPGLDDPRTTLSPNNALYNKLQQRLPDASEKRLLQFTAACHSQGISDRNLTDVHFDQNKGIVSFAGSENLSARTVSVDVKQPSPPPAQSIQQIQQTDQRQVQIQANVQTTIVQNNQQGQQGSGRGGPVH